MTRVDTIGSNEEEVLARALAPWRDLAFAVGPSDEAAETAGVTAIYRLAGLASPSVIRAPSPRAALTVADARTDATVAELIVRDLFDRLDDAMARQVDDALLERLRDGILEGPLRRAILDAWQAVAAGVFGNRAPLTRPGVGIVIQYGQHDVLRPALATLARESGVRFAPDDGAMLESLVGLCGSGWWWGFEGAVVISARPVEIHLDAADRLHAESGLAISWPDGFGVAASHGRVVQDED